MIDFRKGDGAADYLAAAALRQEMSVEMSDDYDRKSPGWRERFAAYFEDRHKKGEGCLFFACDRNQPIGMVIVTLEQGYRYTAFGRRIAYVNGTYVRPEYRRRGVASRFMELVIEWARAQKCSAIRLRTSAAGKPLYEKIGFKPTDEMQLNL